MITFNRRLLRPVIFGLGDGMTSLLGTVFYLSGHPTLVLPAAISSGISSAVSMTGFEWLSDSQYGFKSSTMLGLATGIGCVLPAIPFAMVHGALAIALSLAICAVIATVIAIVRPVPVNGTHLRSISAVIAVVIVAIIAVLICAISLPGGT
jgi:hypothetical protein